jgi:putative hydrolase of the HAD superfamily
MGNVDCITLDAMGVMFRTGDDVRELLYPFILEKGGRDDYDAVRGSYLQASLGRMTAEEFWQAAGINPALEDEYLARHELNEGLEGFLRGAAARALDCWCLSNDLGEWSRKLRRKFSLDRWLAGTIISGDVGLRKPDPAIYRLLLERTVRRAGDILFVDDSTANLDAAAALGIRTLLFDAPGHCHNCGHRTVSSFSELQQMLP